MSKASQDYLIDECTSLLKLMNGQVEKINQSFFSKVEREKNILTFLYVNTCIFTCLSKNKIIFSINKNRKKY